MPGCALELFLRTPLAHTGPLEGHLTGRGRTASGLRTGSTHGRAHEPWQLPLWAREEAGPDGKITAPRGSGPSDRHPDWAEPGPGFRACVWPGLSCVAVGDCSWAPAVHAGHRGSASWAFPTYKP